MDWNVNYIPITFMCAVDIIIQMNCPSVAPNLQHILFSICVFVCTVLHSPLLLHEYKHPSESRAFFTLLTENLVVSSL